MASNFFRQFAIDNNLTVDYGYTYGKYKGFYISIQESFGLSKTLCVNTDLATDKEAFRNVFAVFKETIQNYNLKEVIKNEKYLQFVFNLPTENTNLIVEFLDKFIESYMANNLKVKTICPVCNKEILDGEKVSIIDISGILTPVHDGCFNSGKEKIKKEVKEKNEELNKERKGYKEGIIGAILYSFIYLAIFILGFIFVFFILNNTDTSIENPSAMSVNFFQFICCLVGLSAAPIIYKGYDVFKGKKGPGKFSAVLVPSIVMSILGCTLGFVCAMSVSYGYNFFEMFELIVRAIKYSTSFAFQFFLYHLFSIACALLSLLFTFNNKKERDEANATTFTKLD